MKVVLFFVACFIYLFEDASAACGCQAQMYSAELLSLGDSENDLFEGDVILNTQQRLEVLGFRNTIHSSRQLWPGGVVPYKISDWRHKVISWNIKKALSHLSDATGGCVKFRKATSSDKDYVNVIYGSGCYSYIGRQGGKQDLSLGFGCELKRIVKHEFIHALGFGHEQSRPDRDSHVRIHWNNINSKNCHNYRKWGRLPAQPYDIKSIMHYGEKDFSCNLRWTISTLSGGGVGGAATTSATDIAKIRSLYGCK